MPDSDVRHTDEPLPRYADDVLRAFEGVARAEDGWLALCPAHDDRTPSLRLTVGEAGRLLVCCRAGCPADRVLEAVGLHFADLFPGPSDEPLAPLARAACGWAVADADADLRGEVYDAFLAGLSLQSLHRRALAARGLDDHAIDVAGYKTLGGTSARLLAALHGRFGDRLFGVPGFAPAPGGGARLAVSARGTLVPCRDRRGRVVALKVRRDVPAAGGLRYHYLSGGAGESCGSPVHHPLPGLRAEPHTTPAGTYRVTEGELKADVAWALSGTYTVGVPGVACWGRAVPAVELLGAARCLVAFDWPDVKANPAVRSATCSLARSLRDCGIEPRLETWPDAYKGVDDALAAGLLTAHYRGADADRQLDADRPLYAFAPEPPAPSPAVAPAVAGATPPPAAAANEAGCGAWSPPAFPLQAFPPVLRDFVAAVAAAKQCPPDFPALAVLTVAGAMCGGARALRVTDSWSECPLLYALIVAEPGVRKTPALSAVMAPVYRLQQEERRRYRADRRADPDHCEPMEHFFVDDATVEALVPILDRDRAKGVLAFKDEGVSWVKADGQYKGGRGTDRQFWLSTWAGAPAKVDRKGGASSVYIPRPFVSVLGGIQPDMLSELEDKRGRQDGFVHRVLFSYPRAELPRCWSACGVDEALRQAWADAVLWLRRLEAGGEERDEPREVGLTAGARAAWVAWYNANLAEMADPELDRRLRGPWAKMEAYCARFALISHLLRAACREKDEVDDADELDLANATALVAYFKGHARGVYDALQGTPDDRDVLAVVAWLREARRERCGDCPPHTATTRELMRQFRFRTRSLCDRVLKRATDLGLGYPVVLPGGDGRRGPRRDAYALTGALEGGAS